RRDRAPLAAVGRHFLTAASRHPLLPAWRAIVDALFEGSVDLLDGHQRRGAGTDEPGGRYGERQARGADVVGKLGNPDNVVFAEPEVKPLSLPASGLDGGGGGANTAGGLVLLQTPQAFSAVRRPNQIFRHCVPPWDCPI